MSSCFYEKAANLISKQSEEFNYQMLNIMKSDCDYCLANNIELKLCLCGFSVSECITFMTALYNSFPDDKKPEWISIEDINKYEEAMLAVQCK